MTHLRRFVCILLLGAPLTAPAAAGATLCVEPGGALPCYPTIQAAIAAATAGDTIRIEEGEYVETVVIDKALTIAGTDARDVVIRPAFSAPNPCTGSSLCGGAASNVVLVQADDVTIENLTVDGHNPALVDPAPIVRRGVALHARNGIITNHALGTFGNLRVRGVLVRNIYLRGVYASSGGSFDFSDNTVENVQGDAFSIGMFNFGGAGVFARNSVRFANDAISSNWSGGTQYVDNEVRDSASGIHTDNCGGNGTTTPDVIRGNRVSSSTPGGYGIWVFAPYLPVVVEDNQVTNVDVGLAAFGQSMPVTTTFRGNTVKGRRTPDGAGAFVTTDLLGWGFTDVNVAFTGNVIRDHVEGFIIDSQNGQTLTADLSCNDIQGHTKAGITVTDGTELADFSGPGVGPPGGVVLATITQNIIKNKTVGVANEHGAPQPMVDAQANWWGCAGGPGAPGCDAATGLVSAVPFLSTPPACAPRGLGKF